MKILALLFITFALSTNLYAADNIDFSSVNLNKVFGKYKGCFVIQKEGDTNYYTNNNKLAKTRYSPCSTFKIPNSLISLECAAIADENTIIKWDSVKRSLDEWNRDHDLKSAIRFSVVWYYQELARRVGTEKMQKYLDSITYGNNDITGGIDKFWLNNSLKISAIEQVAFLRKLYRNELPFSQRNIDIVKSILIQDSTPKYIISGKTGSKDGFGWYVGCVERGKDRYYFALNIEGKDAYGQRAKAMAALILKELKLIMND